MDAIDGLFEKLLGSVRDGIVNRLGLGPHIADLTEAVPVLSGASQYKASAGPAAVAHPLPPVPSGAVSAFNTRLKGHVGMGHCAVRAALKTNVLFLVHSEPRMASSERARRCICYVDCYARRSKKRPASLQAFDLYGAGTRNRTRDLLITSQLLYHLSYTGNGASL